MSEGNYLKRLVLISGQMLPLVHIGGAETTPSFVRIPLPFPHKLRRNFTAICVEKALDLYFSLVVLPRNTAVIVGLVRLSLSCSF